MENFDSFILEVLSLDIKVVRLLTSPNEIYSLQSFNVEEQSTDELVDILKDLTFSIKKYWDLSHYSVKDENNFGNHYFEKLSKMATLALRESLSRNNGKEMIKVIEQMQIPFKRFLRNYIKENMNQYTTVQLSDNEINLTINYNQSDLIHNFLNCFQCSGLENNYSGYSPNFIQQLYDIYLKKRGALELLKTNLIGSTNGLLNRKNPFSHEIDKFSFNSLSGEWEPVKTEIAIDGNNFELVNILQEKNNFDNIDLNIVHKHFKVGLVDKGYLSEIDLELFIIAAFVKKETPKDLFSIKDSQAKSKIIKVFHSYYRDIAGKPHGKQEAYCALLGNYFSGYKTKYLMTNFSR